MSMPKFPMTRAGYAVLESELRHRIQTERARLVEEIQEAIADDTNLAENTEYQAAKAEQELNETRIAKLEDKLARAEVIDVSKLSGDEPISSCARTATPIPPTLMMSYRPT